MKDKYNEIERPWINIADELPNYTDEVEVSYDGESLECSANFVELARCMLAGFSGGHGYFYDAFEGIESGLVISDITHWRHYAD